MYHKSSIKPPLSNKPPPSNKGKKELVIRPPPSIKQVQMAAAGGLSLIITMKKDQGYCSAASIWMGCKFIAHFPAHMPFLIYFLGGV